MVSAISERLELSEVILKEFLGLYQEIRELSDERDPLQLFGKG